MMPYEEFTAHRFTGNLEQYRHNPAQTGWFGIYMCIHKNSKYIMCIHLSRQLLISLYMIQTFLEWLKKEETKGEYADCFISLCHVCSIKELWVYINPQRSAASSDAASKGKESGSFNNTESVKSPHPSCLSLKI